MSRTAFSARLIRRPDELPGTPKDLFFLNFKNRWIDVKARGKRVSTLDALVNLDAQRLRHHLLSARAR